MAEIENQLHANHIWVDDYVNYKEYQYAGGTAFKQIHKCAELFKLETTLQDCTQRQVFGCGDCANAVSYNGAAKMYAIPTSYAGGAFYGEGKQLVANDYTALLDYLRSQNGVTAVSESDEFDGYYNVVSVFAERLLPSFFYYDAPIARNRVYARVVNGIDELVSPVVCATPIADTLTQEDVECISPVNGTVAIENNEAIEASVRSTGVWTVWPDVSKAFVSKNQVSLTIHSFTDSIVQAPDEDVLVDYEVIGIVDAAARPSIIAVLTNANNDTIPIGVYVSIDNKGLIRFSGSPTSADESGTTVHLENLVYNI